MSTLAQEQAALAKGEGKLKKFFKAVKKLFAKEFLWVLFILILALPMAAIFTFIVNNMTKIVKYLHFIPKVDTIINTQSIEDVINTLLNGSPLFIGAYAFSIAGIYFTRTVIGAIETMVKKEEG